MTPGFDTGFLVAFDVAAHASHQGARARLDECHLNGDDFALAPQVLAEFVHVVTDRNRFSSPLTIDAALQRARAWWTAAEVRQVFPTADAVTTFVDWMGVHRLGRNRILDTLLAATYFTAGITSVMTTDTRGFQVFDRFQIVRPQEA
jgi:predicted nucleic acid-binding protein